MTKKLFLLTLVLITFNSNAQDSNWAIQANLNPFFLGSLNSEGDYEVNREGVSGGYNIGIAIMYDVSDAWQLEGGLHYSNQIHNGKLMNFVPEGSDYRSDFSYIKVPLIVNYGWDWDYKKDTRLSLGLGGQFLSLNDYFLKIEDRLQIITVEGGQRTLYKKGENADVSVIEDDFYSKNRLGLIGQFGLQKQISDSFAFSIKIRSEYDLSLIDNDNAYNYDLSYFRIGLQFGIQYQFKKTRNSYVKGIL